MKKIMIAMAVVAFAAVAQAASLNWSITAKVVTESPTGSATAGRASFYTALVFMSSDAAAVDTALAAGDFSALSGLAVSTVQAAKAGGFSGTVADLTGSSATIFTVVFDTQAAGDALDTAKYYLKSEAVTQNTYSGTDAATTANFDSSFGKSSWTAVAPEPTSGLLMLVGLGALALRRRRA